MKHKLKGVCAKEVTFRIVAGKLKGVRFFKGCPGNLQAIAELLEDMPVEDVIFKLKGISCGKKRTSCSDQFAKVLRKIKKVRK